MEKSYFVKTLFLILLSTICFIGLKSVLPKRLFSEHKNNTKNIVVDSLLLDALNDTITSDKDTLINNTIFYKKDISGIHFQPEKFDDFKGNQYLISFFEKLSQLEQSKSKKVRIAYFGDSMTDGDMIVQDIRLLFQDTFGGEGVGFVNITSESASSRSSISHEFSQNWKTQSYLKNKRPSRSFGVNGHVFFANDTTRSTWVKYKANGLKHLTSLPNPTVFYGNSTNKKGQVFFTLGKDTIYKKLQPFQKLNTLKLADNVKSLKANFIKADSIPIYGFNFEGGAGVYVDNFSNRGNSGLPISTFNVDLMRAFQEKLNYDLIILHYGTNVLNYGSYNYNWYEQRMAKVVEHIKTCFPGVAVLIISTADKSTKYDMEMKTDSAVKPLVLAQKKYAVKSESGFVNLFTLMGGEGAMTKWVEEIPAKANKDYTHFNYRGAKEVAKLIYNQIIEGYNEYKNLDKTSKKVKRKTDSVFIKQDSTNE